MAIILTDMTIRNLKPGTKEYNRQEKGGFGIRVYPSGTKKFFYLYRIDGKRKFLNLGDYKDKLHPNGITLEEARTAYNIEQGKVAALKHGRSDGVDPVEVKRKTQNKRIAEQSAHSEALTVAKLITEYIEKHAKPSKKSWQDDQRILNKDALPAWGALKAKDIKKRDVVLLLESIVDRGAPGSANNNFKIIRKMFRFAVQRDILEHSPCDGVVMPAPLNRGDRVLNESEVKTLWGNLDTCNISDEIRRVIRLILVTGQRPGEVIGMHTGEIEGRWWTIPAERSKNKKAHRVYLTDTASELIGPLKKIDTETGEEKDRGFIFLSTRPRIEKNKPVVTRKVQPMGRQAPAKAVYRNLYTPVLINGKQVFDKTGQPVTENKLGVAEFTPHDLRRTAATFMSQIGFTDEIIDAVLNHTKQGVIATYNLNRYDKEKQQALEAWERKLNSIITGEQGAKVIPIIRQAV